MTRSLRKKIPDRIKLEVALRRMGLKIEEVQFDHNPALGLRRIDPVTGETIPPANDPNFIDMLVHETEHKPKTFGPGGEKRITTAGGDIHAIAKVKRLEKQQAEFRRRLTAKQSCEASDPDGGTARKAKAKWPKRSFPKRRSTE
jgi:hypothetical protein